MIKIFYPVGRRKWENNLVNTKFEGFEIGPKTHLLFDGSVNELVKFYKIRNYLLSFTIVNKIKRIYIQFKLLFKGFVPLRNLHNLKRFDGIISPQLLVRSSKSRNYICYVENPSSILGYDFTNYYIPKRKKKIINKLRREVNKPQFKGFVFFSNYSRKSFYAFFSDVFKDEFKFLSTVYPFTKTFSPQKIIKYNDLIFQEIQLLYISSLFYLKGGNEILTAVKNLSKRFKIHLTVVTNISNLEIEIKNREIINEKNLRISFIQNNLDEDELGKLFLKSHILLHPTFYDSTAIVVIEALSAGLPVIATDTFAISEYIKHGYNGFLIENPIKFYDMNYQPSMPLDFFASSLSPEKINNYKKNTLYDYISIEIEEFVEKIARNYEWFSNNVQLEYSSGKYNSENITAEWQKILDRVFK